MSPTTPTINPSISNMSNRHRIYVGGLSPKTTARSLKLVFARYGPLQEVDLKSAYAFIEFEDHRDAEDALRDMDHRKVDGETISVEYASRKRDRGDKNMCYNCGKKGHWASECKEEDGRGRCYRCGRKGHERKDCGRSRSRGRADNGGKEDMREERCFCLAPTNSAAATLSLQPTSAVSPRPLSARDSSKQPQEILQPTRTDRADSEPIELPPVSLLSDSPTEEMQISPDLPTFHIPPETFSPCGVPTVANPFLALVPAALPAYSFVFGAQCCPASPSPFVQSALPPVPYAPPAAPPGGLQTGGFHIGVVKRRTR